MFNKFELDLLEEVEIESAILESTKDEINEVHSYIKRMFQHLLKYKYQPERQDRSWCDTIFKEYYNMMDTKYLNKTGVLNGINLDDCYTKARNEALKETNLSQNTIPKQRPYEWDINFVMNYNMIVSYMEDCFNSAATYNFRSKEDMREYMMNKLRKR